jgi:hypothetical protein
VNETVPSPAIPSLNSSLVEAGFREPKEDSSLLNTVLESLIHFIKDNDQALKLPMFIGRKFIDRGESSRHSTSKIKVASQGRDFAWSRGLGVEVSPIKTRSNQKLQSQNTVPINDFNPTPSESGPLRAVKPLFREK